MDPITIATVGLGLGQTIWGAIQNDRGKDRAARNVRPDYKISDQVYKNLGMFEQLGQGGLPENDLTYIHQNAVRGLSASLSAGLQLGANANTVGDYYQSYLDKLADVGVKNAQVRFSNINALAGAREALQKEEFVKFGYNEDAPFKDEAQLSTIEQTQGRQNMFGGLNTALAGYTQGQNRKLYKDLIASNNAAIGSNPPAIPSSLDEPFDIRSTSIDPSNPRGSSPTVPNFPKTASVSGIVNRIVPHNPANPSGDYYWRKLMDENNFWFKAGEQKN